MKDWGARPWNNGDFAVFFKNVNHFSCEKRGL